MQKLKDGQRFSDVATAYSEDKARQGVSGWTLFCPYTSYSIYMLVYLYFLLKWYSLLSHLYIITSATLQFDCNVSYFFLLLLLHFSPYSGRLRVDVQRLNGWAISRGCV